MAAMWPSSWSTKNWVEKRTTTKTLSTESQRCLAGRRKRTPRGLWISKRERGRGHNNIHMYTHTGKGKELKRRGRRRRGEIKSLEASPDWTHKVVRCFKLVGGGWGVPPSAIGNPPFSETNGNFALAIRTRWNLYQILFEKLDIKKWWN